MRTLLLVSALVLTIPATAAVEEIVVSATRSPRALSKVGVSVTVIDPATIASRQTLVMSDLLAQTPGVSVTRNGGPGQATALRIRGAETDQTVVIIDGVKLNDPSSVGGGYNFANLLAGDIARVEVLRGAQSTLWGSQAIGGVVSLATSAPSSPFEGSAALEGGSRGTGLAKAAAGGARDGFEWRVAAGRSITDGISAASIGRERDGFRHTGVSGRTRLPVADTVTADVRAVYSRGRNEFDGFPPPIFVLADTRQFGTTKDFVGYAGIEVDTIGGRWKSRAAYAHTDTDRDDFNPDQAVTTRTFDGIGRNRRGEYQGTIALADGWTGFVGAEHERSSLRTASPSAFAPNPAPLSRSVRTTAGYVQVTGDVDRLGLAAGLRHEDHQTFGGHTVGQASIAWTMNDDATVLRAGWGQGFKAPTLFQLYSAFGNGALQPEQANSWDIGVEQQVLDGAAVVSATLFGRTVTNQIDFVSCPNPSPLCTGRFGFYDNIARTKAHGVEVSAAARFGRLSIDANYSLTDTENTSPGSPNRGKTLARRPRHTANLNASWAWSETFASDVGVRIVGRSFDNAANTSILDSYAVVDLRVSWAVSDTVDIYGRIENALDETYATARGYGQPERGAFAGVRTRF
jgi:vitamin B12 transporter